MYPCIIVSVEIIVACKLFHATVSLQAQWRRKSSVNGATVETFEPLSRNPSTGWWEKSSTMYTEYASQLCN